ncbi:MAG: GatB/YqeY domain-containing protein [Clostridia bacterium]|nr:GatB/YqeY domain-containing protein [Clostridia bacterium]
MILEQIKSANIEALKNKDTIARNIYSVVLNKIKLEEIKKREKQEELKDADIVQILQKSIKELEEEKANYEKVNNESEVENIKTQISILKNYLPQMMSKEEIRKIISEMADKSIGSVMKHFKMNYAGKCDMRDVSEIQKEF